MSARNEHRTERNAAHPLGKGRSFTPVWRTWRESVYRLLPLLLDLGSLAPEIAEVVELGAADIAPGHDLDPVQRRAVDRVGALDPDPEADLANREGLAQAGTLAPDDDALEDL